MKKLFISALCLATLWSCANTEEPAPQTEAGNLYMQFSVKMETTRSATDAEGETNSNANPDYEVGQNYENTISTVDVVLSKDDKYFIAENVKIASAATDTYVASFNTLLLEAGATYKVYIYANSKAPTALNEDATSTAAVADITKENSFWMTNAYAAKEVILPTDLAPYTQPQTPLNLGDHYVERSMARFDFMPKNNNMYNVGAATITLTEAALINQSKEFYLLRRVSDDGTNANWTVGGVETPQNFVVDTDYAAKANGYVNATNFDAHMTAPTSWSWTSLASLSTGDNWTGEAENDHTPSDYKIWCYAKENTIPSAEAQDKGITTGVVFKAQITAADAASDALKAALTAGTETIYVHNNILYGTWADVKAAAEAKDADATLTAAYNQVEAGLAALVENATVADRAKVYAGAGFTGYSPEGGKYYTYYYYWNRHNDNGDPYKMGDMEFAVVRNNVYKLCVDSIAKFGHPTPSGNDPDPDPENPEDPDESVNYYFNVTVKVLPWVVRVNHIEF